MAINPEVKEMLNQLYNVGFKDYSELTPATAREQSSFFASLQTAPKSLVNIKTADYYLSREQESDLLLRCYYPLELDSNDIIIYFHGGGFVLGSVPQYDLTCRWLAKEMNRVIISVDYRLAPENPFPAQIEDAYAALEWVALSRIKLNLPNGRIIVAGDSSGGLLATMVSILSRDRNGPEIAWQWLIYPWVDSDLSRNSYKVFAVNYGLSTAATRWFQEHYLHSYQAHTVNFPPFPMMVKRLSNLPPAFIVIAECDVLFDEVNAYAEKLKSEGNKVYCELASGMIHGFLTIFSLPVCFQAAEKMLKTAKNYFIH